jgi:phage gpG-like protein
MTESVVLTISESGAGLRAVEFAGSNLRIPLEQSIRAWRALGADEFSKAAWRPASGPFRPWAATQDGGIPLKGGGRLLNSWLGGTGGIERINDDSAEFGSALPYAGVHRGEGQVRVAQANQPFRFKMTAKQRAFLAIRAKERGETFGRRALNDPNRGFLIIPRRPHFTTSPELETRITAIFSAHIGGRDVPASMFEA